MDGFTTIREAGGADHSIARLLAERKIVGPRLFYSGRALTQTGGGADFRTPDELTDPCGHVSPFSVMSVIADGVDEVSVHTPDLDDVFFALTGHPTAEAKTEMENAR